MSIEKSVEMSENLFGLSQIEFESNTNSTLILKKFQVN